MTARGLLLDVGSLGAANLGGKLLWALSLALAMRLLGQEEYGRLVVIWSVAGIFAPLTDLGLSALLLRDGARRPEVIEPLALAALAVRFGLSLVVIVLVVLVSALDPESLSPGLVMLAALGPLVDAGFLTVTALAQVEHRVRMLAAWRIVGMASLPLLLLAAGPTLGTAGVACGWILASSIAIGGFLVARRLRKRGTGGMTPAASIATKRLVRDGFPFLLVGMASLSYGKVEVAILGPLAGHDQAALYHAAYQVILLVFSSGEILFAALNAHLFRANARVDELARAWPPIGRVLCMIAIVFAPPLWVHAEALMGLVGGGAFAEAGPVLRALVPMVVVLPVAAALNILVLIDRPLARAALDAGCVLLTAAVAAVFAANSAGPETIAWVASAIYAATCLVALRRVHAQGLRLPWARDLARAALAGAAAMPLLWLPLHWLLASAAYAATVVALLFVFRFLTPADLGKLVPAPKEPT